MMTTRSITLPLALALGVITRFIYIEVIAESEYSYRTACAGSTTTWIAESRVENPSTACVTECIIIVLSATYG